MDTSYMGSPNQQSTYVNPPNLISDTNYADQARSWQKERDMNLRERLCQELVRAAHDPELIVPYASKLYNFIKGSTDEKSTV